MSHQSAIMDRSEIKEIKKLYLPIRKEINARLLEFKEKGIKGSEEDIFTELAFCLLTPQSKAKSCDSAVGCLIEKDIMFQGSASKIARELKDHTRFHNNKARYIVNARKIFTKSGKISIKSHIESLGDPKAVRRWFVSNVKGLGCKEASHFLRNIGMGDEIAILDRHILKNLKLLGVIEEIPNSLTKTKYLEIEGKMKIFSKKIRIPLAHLDLLLWYKETGEIFK